MESKPLDREPDCGFSPHTRGVKCDCGGYAERDNPTPEEEKEYGCGRSGCCARAFVCVLCHQRYVGSADAPEME